jgi:SET domain-containing protein
MNWITPKAQCQTSPVSGKGIFALRKINKGETVAYFGGDIIRIEDFDALPEPVQHFPYHVTDRFLFGPSKVAQLDDTDNWNHSCDPNVGFKGQISLVAMRDITKGEELTFDYAMCMTSTIVNMECECGVAICRKKIKSTDWKRPELQKRYKGFFQPFIAEKIAQQKRKK